jgi:hypothetical protein
MLAPVFRSDILPVEAKGLFGNGSTDNRALIQAQWDAAAAQGKALSITVPGTYMLTATGSGAARYCLQPTTASSRYGLIIGPGVTLKVANSQATNSNPVKLIRFVNHTGGLYVGWPGGGKGGTLSGNTANQPGWTNGYGQVQGNSAVVGDDTNGSGSRDIVVENLYIDDFFSNNIVIGYQTSGVYGAGTQRVYIRGIKTTNCGEGIVLACVDYFGIEDCEDIRALNKMQGDSFEPSFCRYGYVRDVIAHANGDGTVSGGAGIDCYGSRYVTVSDFVIKDCRNGVTLESDFSNVDNYCDEITVCNGVISGSTGEVSPGVQTSTIGIIPSQGGRSTFSNILIENYYTSGFQLAAQTVTDGSAGAHFQADNLTFRNCATSILSCTTGNITADLSSVWFGTLTSGASDFCLNLSRASGSNTLNANLIGLGGAGFQTAGIRVDGGGATFQPTGRIDGCRFVITGGAVALSLATGADLSGMLVDDQGVLREISATGSYLHHGCRFVSFNAVNGALTTLNPGTIGQLLTIDFQSGTPGVVNDKVANGSGNIRLLANLNATFNQYDTLTLQWVSSLSEWHEVARRKNTSVPVTIQSTAAADVPLLLRSTTSQSGNVLEIRDVSSNLYGRIGPKREYDANGDVFLTWTGRTKGFSGSTYGIQMNPTMVTGTSSAGTFVNFEGAGVTTATSNPLAAIVEFQSNPTVNSACTVTTVTGFRSQSAASSSGVITNLYGVRCADVFTASGGSVTNHRAIWVDDLSLASSLNIALRTGQGDTIICQHASARFGIFTVTTPVVQYTTTGTTTGFTAGAGTAVLSDSTFTGNDGTKAYTIGDIVRALKSYGFLAKS